MSVHTCSYYCDRPDCIRAQRDELRQKLEQVEKQEGWVLREVYFSEGEPISHREPQWVSLTDEEIKEIVGPWGETPIKGYTRKLFDAIEAKLKEKNA
jgi:hypothetical protein